MTIKEISDWLNSNTGVLSVLLFIATLLTGWASGIFKSLIKRPKFKVRIIPKMTYGSIYMTGEKYTPPTLGAYDLHKTAFVVYLEITNQGTSPSTLGKIQIGYFKDDGKNTLFQKRLWIKETNILADFSIPTGDGQAIGIPHLRQLNPQLITPHNGYLKIGDSKIGAVYFEQSKSWGNFYPRIDKSGEAKIKIVVTDAFGNKYSKKQKVKILDLKDALRYNPRFGFTEHLFDKDVENLRNETSKDVKGGTKD